MEKLIIVWEKETLKRIDFIKNIVSSNSMDILIIDPKESPNYEEIIKNAWECLLCTLDDSQPEWFRKEKILEYKNIPHVLDWIDPSTLFNNTPWYDRFLKKWRKDNHRPSKTQFKNRWNKHK